MKTTLLLVICALAFSGCAHIQTESEQDANPMRIDTKAWRYANVGVADLDEALMLWRDQFGFEITFAAEGSDPGLEMAWGLESGAIVRQAVLSGGPEIYGKIHLVEFKNPLPAVREGVELYDSAPKNLDVYTNDLAGQMRRMQSEGYTFRNPEPQEFVASGITIKEGQMPAHDETNIVIMQREDIDVKMSAGGFGGLGLIVYAAENVELEEHFLQSIFGVETLHDVELGGPELEAITGLAPGTRWYIRIVGDPSSNYGQIEVIDYRGVDGADRFSRARPGALGLFEVTYEASNLDTVVERLSKAEQKFDRVDGASKAGLCVDVVNVKTPAGMPIQIMSKSAGCETK